MPASTTSNSAHASSSPFSDRSPRRAELDTRASTELLHRARHEHLAGHRLRRDSRGSVYCDTADVVAASVDLAGVETRPDADLFVSQIVLDRTSRADRTARKVEDREQPITRRLDNPTSVAFDSGQPDRVVEVQPILPCCVTEPGRGLGRPDDVGEQNRGEEAIVRGVPARTDDEPLDLVEHRILITDPRHVVDTRQDHQSRVFGIRLAR